MTRINLVHPSELSRLHLVAEYRELPRIFSLVRSAIARDKIPSDFPIPSKYVLGAGHMYFFYDKCCFLAKRQRSLIREMQNRNIVCNYFDATSLLEGITSQWLGDYTPTQEAL